MSVRTSVGVRNLHCPSCVRTIHEILNDQLSPKPQKVAVSLVSQIVDVYHDGRLDKQRIAACLESAGFVLMDKRDTRPSKRIKTVKAHKDYCQACQKDDEPGDDAVRAVVSISGMTCASCTGAVRSALEGVSGVRDVSVDLMSKQAKFSAPEGALTAALEAVSNAGYDAELLERESSPPRAAKRQTHYMVAIEGMHCASCQNKVQTALQGVEGASDVTVDVMSNHAALYGPSGASDAILAAVSQAGYEGRILEASESLAHDTRSVKLLVSGMFCGQCVEKVNSALDSFGAKLTHDSIDLDDALVTVNYTPEPPVFTVRQIIKAIDDLGFDVEIYKPPSVEDLARDIQRREKAHLLHQILVCGVLVIPTFFLGIVVMLMLPSGPVKDLFDRDRIGHLNLMVFLLGVCATPVEFYVALPFHTRAIHGLWSVWKNPTTTVWHKVTRFGSMDLLVSSAISVAYFSSVAMAVLSAMGYDGMEATYFDSTVFLVFFILIGRYLEAYSKLKTTDAASSLNAHHPQQVLILPEAKPLPADQAEVGDSVRVVAGAAAAVDGTVFQGESIFDESALTGESSPVAKAKGDPIYAGTINVGNSVDVHVTEIASKSLFAEIIRAVQTGQSRQSRVEHVADTITAYFVPCVTYLAIVTWIVWFVLGTCGILDPSYVKGSGGWPFWALKFAIAVFVVACPCGIGLAAPTACYVGASISARQGILAQGGGEAFQDASHVDCVVFDKTGTLTHGKPQVVKARASPDSRVKKLVFALEQHSNHPLSHAIRDYCEAGNEPDEQITLSQIEEISGRGLKCVWDGKELLVGNEKLMRESKAAMDPEWETELESWKRDGCSVVLFAIKEESDFKVQAQFGIADEIRREANYVVRKLHQADIATFMVTGDNQVTASAIAERVGIPLDNVISGVLPMEKADAVHRLQATVGRRGRRRAIHNEPRRGIVAMVGDGINDSPALSAADVGIAMGSGSDIALNAAHFILVRVDLVSVLRLFDISRVVYRRIIFNFAWAMVYNVIGIPFAAGVFLPLGLTLDPVWAALAMAMSSVSVVSSSFALNFYKPPKYEEALQEA